MSLRVKSFRNRRFPSQPLLPPQAAKPLRFIYNITVRFSAGVKAMPAQKRSYEAIKEEEDAQIINPEQPAAEDDGVGTFCFTSHSVSAIRIA